ncbi:MAG: hypothetical protein JSV24_06895 [Bacteroidales bacterium]|nr:MAG: hypothetical protein JSV24_06895 [Bacteroidales bacterium]
MEEISRTLENVLASRIRALFPDVDDSLRIAPETTALMAEESGFDDDWINARIRDYSELAKGYTINS